MLHLTGFIKRPQQHFGQNPLFPTSPDSDPVCAAQQEDGNKICTKTFVVNSICQEVWCGNVCTDQDGQQSANECDGGRDGRQQGMLGLLHQAARHGGFGKLRLLQQLQTNA